MPQLADAPAIPDEVDLTILVPCLNEEARVVSTLQTIEGAMAELGCSYEVIVVDDGSTDRTPEVVQEFIRSHEQMTVRLHQNSRNLGLARTFVDTAFRGHGKYYRLVCGDNVEPKETMVSICAKMGDADIIVPYYPILPGKSVVRRFISNLFTLLVNLLSGYSLHYYNGCALYRRFHVMRWAPYNYGFGFQSDLITKLFDEGATYVEIPVTGYHFTKESGATPLNFRNFVSTGHTLFEILLRRIRRVMFESHHSKLTIDR